MRPCVLSALLLAAPFAVRAAPADPYVGGWALDASGCGSPMVRVVTDGPDGLVVRGDYDGVAFERRVEFDPGYVNVAWTEEDPSGRNWMFSLEPGGGALQLGFLALGGPKKVTIGGVTVKHARGLPLVRCAATAPSAAPTAATGPTLEQFRAARASFESTFAPSWLEGSWGEVEWGDGADGPPGTPRTSTFTLGVCRRQAAAWSVRSAQSAPTANRTGTWQLPDGTEVHGEGWLTFRVAPDGALYHADANTSYKTMTPVETWDTKTRGTFGLVLGSGRITVSVAGYVQEQAISRPPLELWEPLPTTTPVDAGLFVLALTPDNGPARYVVRCQ